MTPTRQDIHLRHGRELELDYIGRISGIRLTILCRGFGGAPNQVCNRCVTLSSTFLSRISLAGIPSNYPDNYGTPAEAYHPCGTKCGSRGIINAGSRQAVPVIKQPAVYFRQTGPSHINRAVEVEFLTNPSTQACGHGNHRAKTFI